MANYIIMHNNVKTEKSKAEAALQDSLLEDSMVTVKGLNCQQKLEADTTK